jgi:Tol biopolymer transport system component
MFRNRSLKFSVVSLIAISLFILPYGLVRADQEDEKPIIGGQPGKVKVGVRPPGQIAFIKDGGIWIMDTDGKNRQAVCVVTNSFGRVSFSPDNRRIAFARRGSDANKLPSDEGGRHQLHDIFIAFVDSASTNTGWWNRVTFGLGGYFPQWSDNDSMIYYQNDINANFVDYIVPSYQLAKVSTTDGHADYLRKDWQTCFTSMLMPAFTRDGKRIAYVISYSPQIDKYTFKNFGIKITEIANIMKPEEEMRKPTKGLEAAVAPSWSPDGKLLAYINNDMRNPGIFIYDPASGEKRQVFSPSVTQLINANPVGWSPDSKWMTFATNDGVIYVIDINGEHLTPLTGTGAHSSPAWSN